MVNLEVTGCIFPDNFKSCTTHMLFLEWDFWYFSLRKMVFVSPSLKTRGIFWLPFQPRAQENKATWLFKTWSRMGVQVLWGQNPSLFFLLLWNMRNTVQVCGHTTWCTYYISVCLKLALLNSDGELQRCEIDIWRKWVRSQELLWIKY